jgi:CubicO group peptidase (beta-lactamase class C family)
MMQTLQRFSRPTAAQQSCPHGAYDVLDAYLEQQMRLLNIPGVSLAVVEGDQVTHLRSFGKARPGGEAPSAQTPFLIGSLTKSFTALAVMQLVEAGKIELDVPVQRYLPWFRVADPQASAQITVRHLLNHTSGLPTSSGWAPLADFDARPGACERQARALATLKLAHLPGATHAYSNANYNLLGLIIEAASGEPYEAYVKSHLFAPLDMRHSYTAQAEAKQDGLAVGHQYWFWRPFAVPNLATPRGSLPSGQIISSAEDMAHYLIAHLNEGRYGDAQLLSPEGIAELHHGSAPVYFGDKLISQYGMGWYEEQRDQVKIVWHAGTVPDFASFMALLPAHKKGIVLLINVDHFMMNPVTTELGMGAVALLAGQRITPGLVGIRFSRIIPWVMRALLLLPLLQVAGVAITLRQLGRWRQAPPQRPDWGRHLLLPLIPNLSLMVLATRLLTSKMFGFFRLFLPDLSWLVLLCGGFAGVWACVRSGLVLKALRTRAKT